MRLEGKNVELLLDDSVTFLFQTGAIRSDTFETDIDVEDPGFYSKLVRLEDNE